MTGRVRLLVDCGDRRGIVAAVASVLARHEANIVEADQHSTGPGAGRFFMRMVFDADADGGPALDDLRAAAAERWPGVGLRVVRAPDPATNVRE